MRMTENKIFALYILGVLVGLVITVAVGGLVIMLAWNYVIATVFEIAKLSYLKSCIVAFVLWLFIPKGRQPTTPGVRKFCAK